MSKLSSPFPELAEKLYIPSSYDERDSITRHDLLDKESNCTIIYIFVCEADLKIVMLFVSV